jgi:preprotein translocase subunit SecF
VFDFAARRLLFFVISSIVILPGLISLVLPGGINPGIDFTSGSIFSLRFDGSVDQSQLRQAFADLHHPEAIIQRSEDVYLVRTFPLAPEARDDTGAVVQGSERQGIEDALGAKFGSVAVVGFDAVSPLVAREIVQRSVLAVLAASVGILLYLWYAFRSVAHAWRYGVCAVAALAHDVVVLLGIFSLLGRFFAIEIDSLFITAMLIVIGFSVHDTIIVFDRIRENASTFAGAAFATIVNHSLMQTLARSLITSLTLLLAMLSVLLFGGVTIRSFVIAVLIGVTSGTYSSIFNASMLLVAWEEGRPAHGPSPAAMPSPPVPEPPARRSAEAAPAAPGTTTRGRNRPSAPPAQSGNPARLAGRPGR